MPVNFSQQPIAVVNLIFFKLPLIGEGVPLQVDNGWWYVPSSHRLSIQTTVVSDTVWLQFVIQVLTEGSELTVWGEGVVIWGWRWVLWVDRWWLPHSDRIGLYSHRFLSDPTWHGRADWQTDRRTDGKAPKLDRIEREKSATCCRTTA